MTNYQWDAEGRLKSVNNGAARSYVYNALGREVEWHGDGRVSEDLTDLAGHYLGSVDPSSGAWTGERIPGSSIYLAWYVNGGTTFFYYNALGSSMMNTHQDGNTVSNDVLFYPWGQLWASPVNDYFQFFGNIEGWDWEIGEGVAPNRYYPNYQGRWLSPDPLAGDISNPQSLNLYAYVLNNPTTLTDPLGLDPGCPSSAKQISSGQCMSKYPGGELRWPWEWMWDAFELMSITVYSGTTWREGHIVGAGKASLVVDSPDFNPAPDAQQPSLEKLNGDISKCVSDTYSSTPGKLIQLASPLSLIPGFNPNWKNNLLNTITLGLTKVIGVETVNKVSAATTTEFSSIIKGGETIAVPGEIEAATGATLNFAKRAAPVIWGAASVADLSIHRGCSEAVLSKAGLLFPSPF